MTLPPPAPNRKLGDLSPEEIAILLPPDEDDQDGEPIAAVTKKTPATRSPAAVQPPSKPAPPPFNAAAIKEEVKAEKERSQNSSIVKSIVEQKRKSERKTLVVTLILSVLGAIIFTSLVASLLSPSQLQKYEPPITEQTKTITDQNDTKIQPADPDDSAPPIELIEPTDD